MRAKRDGSNAIAGCTPHDGRHRLAQCLGTGTTRHVAANIARVSESVMRVASSVGEGSVVVQAVHHYLAPSPV